MTADRIKCCVPFCRRTAPAEKFKGCKEIICGKHGRMAPRTLRLRYRKLSRRYRRNLGGLEYWDHPSGSPKRLEGIKLARILDKLWERYKASAIEAAGGLR
jgi:hypothetical protein